MSDTTLSGMPWVSITLAADRARGAGTYLLDEPDAALSFGGRPVLDGEDGLNDRGKLGERAPQLLFSSFPMGSCAFLEI